MSNIRLNKLMRQNSRLEFQSSGELFRPEYEREGEEDLGIEQQQEKKNRNEKIWKLMNKYSALDMESI